MYNYVLCIVRLSIIDDPRAENQKLADHHFEVKGSGFFFGTYCFVFRCGDDDDGDGDDDDDGE